jgi:hypothetical protein
VACTWKKRLTGPEGARWFGSALEPNYDLTTHRPRHEGNTGTAPPAPPARMLTSPSLPVGLVLVALREIKPCIHCYLQPCSNLIDAECVLSFMSAQVRETHLQHEALRTCKPLRTYVRKRAIQNRGRDIWNHFKPSLAMHVEPVLFVALLSSAAAQIYPTY